MVEGTSIEAGAGAGVETEKERDTVLIGTETNTVKLTRASRSRSRSRSPSHRHSKDKDDEKKSKRRRRRSRSRSYSSFGSSDSESESESESEDERRRRKRKERERRRDKEDREERRRRKEKKREKKAKKDSGTASSTAKWGQHGIISEIDLPKKDSEFRAWLVEERKINPETISKDRTKKEFAVFVEDYNTATLPHEKYYDMSKYEFKMNMIRSGQTLPDETGGYDPLADMKAHSSSLRTSAPKEKETFLSKEKIAELRRVEAERTEIAKRRQMGLDVNKNLGVRMEDRL
ncbi:hypothetical protein L486_04541 [Kwoniella mangroviensis CBS 10435]|uniref:Uncharacterized protein n=1 Tax=Kwoniella mangroviensis CBS 10435 TaxID=1331196 RepID=A0A1B9ISJ1_9TREE|nr:hypothetical protein L486_04541 [Kwoniella mangroviensis CBS 10435]